MTRDQAKAIIEQGGAGPVRPEYLSEHESLMIDLIIAAKSRAERALYMATSADERAAELEEEAAQLRKAAIHGRGCAAAERAAAEHLLTLWEE